MAATLYDLNLFTMGFAASFVSVFIAVRGQLRYISTMTSLHLPGIAACLAGSCFGRPIPAL
jgi:hypothetical protein